MALGTDTKSLVDDILASREDRAKAVSDIRKDTHRVLAEAKRMVKDFAKESEERVKGVKHRACEVKSFLKSSDETRQQDFGITMKAVQSALGQVRKDSKHARNAAKDVIKDAQALLENIAKDNKAQAKELQETLKKAEHNRAAEFKSMMGGIGEGLKEIKHNVSKVKKDAQEMVSRYHYSRMSAQKHWALLSQGRKKAKNPKSEEQ